MVSFFTYFPYTQKFVEVSSQINFFSFNLIRRHLSAALAAIRASKSHDYHVVSSVHKKVFDRHTCLIFYVKMIDKMHFCIIF